MISTNRIGGQINEKATEFRGLSTDTKPSLANTSEEVQNGSVYVEMDTAKIWMYSESDDTWYEL